VTVNIGPGQRRNVYRKVLRRQLRDELTAETVP
jgi:hypothetical protein